MVKLTEKQKRFCEEYLKDLNATQAYKIAYPNVKRDSTASQAGSRMLRNVKVQTYIEKRMKDREKRTEITQDMVIKELATIAFAKTSDYVKVIEKQACLTREDGVRIPLFDQDGKPVMVNDIQYTLTDNLTDEQIRAIATVKHGKYGVVVEQYDKNKALELLGRHLGMFKDRVEVSGVEEEKSKLDDLIKQMRGDE